MYEKPIERLSILELKTFFVELGIKFNEHPFLRVGFDKNIEYTKFLYEYFNANYEVKFLNIDYFLNKVTSIYTYYDVNALYFQAYDLKIDNFVFEMELMAKFMHSKYCNDDLYNYIINMTRNFAGKANLLKI